MKNRVEKIIGFENIYKSNLVVDALYKGGNNGNMSDEVLSKLMMCENSGGFRKRGSINPFDLKYVVLYSTNKNKNWINQIDFKNKRVYYYGDNTKNEIDMLKTKKKGNLILKNIYDCLNNNDRKDIPPFFMFTSEQGRDVRFIGLLVPGDDRLSKDVQLIKVVDEVDGKKIENYKAVFTILDIKEIDRRWIEDLNNGEKNSKYAPDEWNKWRNNSLENLKFKTIIESDLSLKENEEEIKINMDTSTFYILEDKIELPNKIRIPGQNNHLYITISEAHSRNEELKYDNENKKIVERDKKIFSEVEVSDFEDMEEDYSFIEGEEYIRIEKRKKRDSSIRKLKIDFVKKQLGQAVCEVCGESDEVVLDVHHEKVMVSNMEKNHVTKLSDLRILCANCHRRVHKYKLKIDDLKKKFNSNLVTK